MRHRSCGGGAWRVRRPCDCLFVAYVCNLACHAPSVTHFSLLLLLLRLSSSLQLATRKTQAKLITFHEWSIWKTRILLLLLRSEMKKLLQVSKFVCLLKKNKKHFPPPSSHHHLLSFPSLHLRFFLITWLLFPVMLPRVFFFFFFLIMYWLCCRVAVSKVLTIWVCWKKILPCHQSSSSYSSSSSSSSSSSIFFSAHEYSLP